MPLLNYFNNPKGTPLCTRVVARQPHRLCNTEEFNLATTRWRQTRLDSLITHLLSTPAGQLHYFIAVVEDLDLVASL